MQGLRDTIGSLRDTIEGQQRDLASTRAQLRNVQNEKASIQNDYLGATEYMATLEDKVYQANVTSLDLLNTLKDAELEIETLKHYIVDLKSRIAVYIPVKGDPVDKKLAEYINNYPDR